MDTISKLEKLNLTPEEINRFSTAFKDEKFRELLKEYAEEISNPENKKRYEEDIALLEQERGMDIKFIHPTPERVLKTSLDGKQKCYINICGNELIAKPECKTGKGADGKVGQHWSLPYSVTPGRPDMDSKGNKHIIYDVIFHPDTLSIAGKNTRFMNLVDSTAIQGIQSQFKVLLDETNLKVLKIKYKGVPNPSVIRKPIPSHSTKAKQTDPNDPLSFPYPYQVDQGKLPKSKLQDKPVGQLNPDTPLKQTEPRYTIKYRSYIDLQDYRYARDATPGPRPKEMIITIDLPLLKSAGDAELNVTERHLLLESHKPAYKLELPLSYPVDEKNGEAKFNKLKRQLTVTLPVLQLKNPMKNYSDHPQSVSHLGNNEEDEVNGKNVMFGPGERGAGHTMTETVSTNKCDYVLVHKSEMETFLKNTQLFEPTKKPVPSLPLSLEVTAVGGGKAEEECVKSPSRSDLGHQSNMSSPVDLSCNAKKNEEAAGCEENDNDKADVSTCSNLPDRVLDTSPCVDSCVWQTETFSLGTEEVEENPTTPAQTSGPTAAEDLVAPPAPDMVPGSTNELPRNEHIMGSTNELPQSEHVTGRECEGTCHSESAQTVPKMPYFVPQCTDAGTLNETDKEAAPSVQSCQTFDNKVPPAILKEINLQDGRVEVISDHTTSAAFSFQNTLLYDLD